MHLHWIEYCVFRWDTKRELITTIIFSLQFIIDIIFVRLLGVKIVWTVHNYLSHDTPFPRLELWVRRILSKLVNKIILLNKSTQDEIVKQYKTDLNKTCFIPHGHYRDAYEPLIEPIDAKTQLNLPLTGKIYLFLGILKPYKGIEDILEIWKSDCNLSGNHTLVIAGKPSSKVYGSKLTEIVSEIKGAVIYPRFIKDNEINIFFSAADVIILPFKKILNSGSLILAMSYDKPIIAPRLEVIKEILGKADTLLYHPEDQNGLLAAIKKSNQINLGELSQQVRNSCNNLNWENIGEKTFHVYWNLFQ